MACKQLGFRGAVRAISSLVRTEAQFWLTSVACGGYERYLDHCSFQSWDVPNCNRFEYAGVVCTADGELLFVYLFICLLVYYSFQTALPYLPYPLAFSLAI